MPEPADSMEWLAEQLADIPIPLDVENVRDLDNMELLERRLHSLRSAYLLDYYRRHPQEA